MKKSLLSAVALTAVVAFGGSAWAEVLVGVAGPLTGPNAAFGAQLQKGAEQAAADINAAGGLNVAEELTASIRTQVAAAYDEAMALNDRLAEAFGLDMSTGPKMIESAARGDDRFALEFYRKKLAVRSV